MQQTIYGQMLKRIGIYIINILLIDDMDDFIYLFYVIISELSRFTELKPLIFQKLIAKEHPTY
ncbi:hypothetical protein D3C72_2173790 [compost metagenome]